MKTLLGVLTAVLLLALPGSAVANDNVFVHKPEAVVRLSLRGSHGYRVSVTNRGARRRVVLTARKGSTRAVYSVHGSATRDRIVGNFGNLGKISLRFQPSSQKPKRGRVGKDCEGKPATLQSGRFVGTIRFEGEEGFSSVAATSAEGTVLSRHRVVCPLSARTRPGATGQSSASRDSTLIYKDFLAIAVDHDHSIYVRTVNASYAEDPTPDGFTLGEAAITERRGRITIGRSVEFVTEVDPVQASPLGTRPITATVMLPGPLEGTGSFVEDPGSAPSWSGNLSVRLPGGGVVPLTGSEFKAILCHGSAFSEKMDNCEDQLDDLLFRGFRYPLF